jgi:hypothetical protein
MGSNYEAPYSLVDYLGGIIVSPEDRGNMFLGNVGNYLKIYPTSHLRRAVFIVTAARTCISHTALEDNCRDLF